MTESWPRVRLGEVLVQHTQYVDAPEPRMYLKLSVKLYGKGVIVDSPVDGAQLKMQRHQLAKTGQVILSEIWGKKGAIGLVPPEGAGSLCTSHFFLFDVVTERLDRDWLRAVFAANYLQEQLEAAARGSTGYAAVRPKTLLACEIPLPPLAEQRRIVARMEELACKITEARSMRQGALEKANSLLSAASALAFEPKSGWSVETVGQFCEPPQYGFTASATTEPVGPRLLRITDIQDGVVDWASVPYCQCPEPGRYLLHAGDLVFARTGATTGKSFLIPDCPEAVFASYLIRLRVRAAVSVDYLYRYFQSPGYWVQIADQKRGTGQPNLNGSVLEQLQVPIAPAQQQRGIVAYLDGLQATVDSVKHLQNATAAELDALLPSILDKAFKGEL